MTGANKSNKAPRRRASKQNLIQTQPSSQAQEEQLGSPPGNVKREQPASQQVVKRIIKAESDEARTLKTVFKSNPDTQMRDFIKKASTKPIQPTTKTAAKTPADTHPPAIAQELLDTDDDVADNLVRLFKTSKSFKNI